MMYLSLEDMPKVLRDFWLNDPRAEWVYAVTLDTDGYLYAFERRPKIKDGLWFDGGASFILHDDALCGYRKNAWKHVLTMPPSEWIFLKPYETEVLEYKLRKAEKRVESKLQTINDLAGRISTQTSTLHHVVRRAPLSARLLYLFSPTSLYNEADRYYRNNR